MPRRRLSHFGKIDENQFIDQVKAAAGDKTNKSLLIVAERIVDIPEFSCSLNIKKDEGLERYIKKWTRKYLMGYENRPSNRQSNPTTTVHDNLLDEIISARLPKANKNLDLIKHGHRISMGAENIAGSLLEEFVSEKLLPMGWHCCWGDTMKSIDFCHEKGRILQVKNSDNSENSSSKTVRDGTKIEHWYRRFSRTGDTNWAALKNLAGIDESDKELSEETYLEFVRNAVKKNPEALYVEHGNPWL